MDQRHDVSENTSMHARYVDRRTAAKLTTLSYSVLANLAGTPDGPTVIRVGRRVVYDVEDLVAWMTSRKSIPARKRGRPRKSI